MPKNEKLVAIAMIEAAKKGDEIEFTIKAKADTEEHLERTFEIVSEAILGSVPANEQKPARKTGNSFASNWGTGSAWGNNKKNRPN